MSLSLLINTYDDWRVEREDEAIKHVYEVIDDTQDTETSQIRGNACVNIRSKNFTFFLVMLPEGNFRTWKGLEN